MRKKRQVGRFSACIDFRNTGEQSKVGFSAAGLLRAFPISVYGFDLLKEGCNVQNLPHVYLIMESFLSPSPQRTNIYRMHWGLLCYEAPPLHLVGLTEDVEPSSLQLQFCLLFSLLVSL